MEKMKKNRKGFTIVELVIVIALIAILAAVLIPTFSNVINNAHESSDTTMVKNLNTILNSEEVLGKRANTMQEAIDQAEEGGYKVDKLTPTSTGHILWDQTSNRFLLVNAKGSVVYKDESATGDVDLTNGAYKLWKITKNATKEDKGYSLYLAENATAPAGEIDFGIDVGVNKDVAVDFKSTDAREVIIRTNGGTLNVDAKNASVKHYGLADKVNVENVAANSYHENGFITSYIKVASGRIVLENGSSVSMIAIAGDLGNISVKQETGAEVFKVVSANNAPLTANAPQIDVATGVIDTTKAYENAEALTDVKYGGGDGKTAATAYELYTASHLAAFAKDVNEGKLANYIYAKLCANINIGGMAWEPIGNIEHPFHGSFDGGNHTVTGLTNKGYSPAATLFGTSQGAKNYGTAYGFFGVVGAKRGSDTTELKFANIKFENVNIDIDYANMLGVLIGADTKAAKNAQGEPVNGDLANAITIENVTVKGRITSKSGASVGGVAGKLYTSSLVIKNCSVTGNFNLTNNANESSKTDIKAGGIVGFRKQAGLQMESCTATVDVKIDADIARAYYGGLVCYQSADSTTITIQKNSTVAGKIEVNGATATVALYVVDFGKKATITIENTVKSTVVSYKANGKDVLEELKVAGVYRKDYKRG